MIRAGDAVLHRPSGEEWLVAYVDGDRLAWCGWPEGEAALADCELVRRCSDDAHVKLLRQIVGDHDRSMVDKRTRMAARAIIKNIDTMFENAADWGSWMVAAANERETLVDRLRRSGIEIEHKWRARAADGRRVT